MSDEINRVFIGSDLRQPLALSVLTHSIHATARKPVSVIPLLKHQLPIKRFGLTDFTFSRFLVPWLCGFKGRALFMDGDMVVLEDINNLFEWHEQKWVPGADTPPVSCVLDQPGFEWPSLMLFDNEHMQCERLTPEYINDANNDLLSLQWASSIGELPKEWNVMVRASEPYVDLKLRDTKVLHFTEGLPCFYETQHTPGAKLWHDVRKEMNYTVGWHALMGKSVHAGPVLEQLFNSYGVNLA